MQFIIMFPRTSHGFDSIWDIIDILTKSAHFIPISKSNSAKKLTDVYIIEVVAYHGVPDSAVSDRDVHLTYRFWKKFNEVVGTQLHFNTSYYLRPIHKASGVFK